MEPEELTEATVTEGGTTAIYPEVESLPILVAPSLKGKGKNTIRMELIPVACWKLDGIRFAFQSSFVLSETREEFLALSPFRKGDPGAPMSAFGQAEPVGDDAFNKKLSGRRAKSIYAVLTRDTASLAESISRGTRRRAPRDLYLDSNFLPKRGTYEWLVNPATHSTDKGSNLG